MTVDANQAYNEEHATEAIIFGITIGVGFIALGPYAIIVGLSAMAYYVFFWFCGVNVYLNNILMHEFP